MFDQLKKNWDIFKQSEPGKRFKDRYHRRSEKRHRDSKIKVLLNISIGIVIIIIGMIFWFIPGPGWLMIFIGAAIIAGESIITARFLDYIEVKIRELRNAVKEKRKSMHSEKQNGSNQ